MFRIGIVGSILAALCCVTPILPIVLTSLGLTGVLGLVYTDLVLLPVLAGFLAMTGFAYWKRNKQKST